VEYREKRREFLEGMSENAMDDWRKAFCTLIAAGKNASMAAVFIFFFLTRF
jgi:hypothetical protein